MQNLSTKIFSFSPPGTKVYIPTYAAEHEHWGRSVHPKSLGKHNGSLDTAVGYEQTSYILSCAVFIRWRATQ